MSYTINATFFDDTGKSGTRTLSQGMAQA